MRDWEREYHVARLVAGKTRVVVDGVVYMAGTPSKDQRLLAMEVYMETFERARDEGSLTADEALDRLVDAGVWTPRDAGLQESLEKDVDNLKVALFENFANSDARRKSREMLRVARAELERLAGIKHGMDHATCETVAATARARFLVGCSLARLDGRPYWKSPLSGWKKADGVLDRVMEKIVSVRLDERGIREVARTDPWATSWALRKYCRPPIDACSSELGDEQKALLTWSAIYESASSHPDAPGKDVFEDDDTFDGWQIVQRRKHETDAKRRMAEELAKSAPNANEVFIVAASNEDASLINTLNDAEASGIIRQRMQSLRSKGELNEADMPDTAMRIGMDAVRLQAARMKR